MGLNILVGYTGQISIGHAAFMSVGAYTAANLAVRLDLPFWITLPVGGLYKRRQSGEAHAFGGTLIHTLQHAVATDSYQTFKRYSEGVRKQAPVALRDLLDFRTEGLKPIALEEVESITEIRKRLISPGTFALYRTTSMR